MKPIFTILIFLIGSSSIFSQDHIITKNGNDLKVTIKEIRQTDVTFIMFNDSTEEPYVMDKIEIEKIVFSNGAEERFGNQNNETIINNSNTNKNKNPDKIYTMDGKVIYCEVVEKKRFGVNYVPVKSNDNYIEYLANTKIEKIEYANGDVDYISGSPENDKNRKDAKDFSYLSPNYISVNVGPALPFGLFGASSSTSNISLTGLDVNIDASYYLFRGMGFGITTGYMFNPTSGAQQNTLTAIAQTGIPGTATDIKITVDGWSNVYIMAGMGYYSEYKRFLLDYKAVFGAFISYYPAAIATYTDNGITQTSVFSDQSIAYVFGGQISGRYFITRKFQLKFNIASLFGRANFQGLVRKDYQNGVQVGESVAGQLAPMNLSWINFSFGVAYTIGK